MLICVVNELDTGGLWGCDVLIVCDLDSGERRQVISIIVGVFRACVNCFSQKSDHFHFF